ncbi:MAG TPA: TRAP transporter TatT component family protein [Deferrisomatales bacterium]|nr:TRAP transporter TatT component family protein [Deferrisomatales bacterium]
MRRLLAAFALCTLLAGCASLLGSATGRLAADLSAAIANQDDPRTVRDGAPAYLLLVDGLIEGDPGDVDLLLTGARLYGTYAAAFVEDPDRARRLAAKARRYGDTALCECDAALCAAARGPLDGFLAALTTAGPADAAVLQGFAAAWAGWVQANPADWDAIADLPKIQAALRRVVELDDTLDGGAPHLYLGVLATLRPAQLGGDPEGGRAHFERALELSAGRDLMAKVLFAQHYARLVFDRELHDRLLGEVLAADPVAPGRTLSNTLAQERAAALLAGAEEYF